MVPNRKLRENFEKRLLLVMTTPMSRLLFEKSTMTRIIRHFWTYVADMLFTTTTPLVQRLSLTCEALMLSTLALWL